MNPQESIDLKKLISQSDSVDNTEQIRCLKHSSIIRGDVQNLVKFISVHSNDTDQDPLAFEQQCRNIAPFLSASYNDLFIKTMKMEINFFILEQLLDVLLSIEDQKVDQHEGSVLVGKILKELYVDSAIRRGENLDKQYAEDKPESVASVNISWSQYKKGN